MLTTPPTAPTIANPIPKRCDPDFILESGSLYSCPKRKGGRATSKTPAIDKVADVMSGPVNDPDDMSATMQQVPSGARKFRTVASDKGIYFKEASDIPINYE